MSRDRDTRPGPSEGAPGATGDGPGEKAKWRRVSAKRKVDPVLRLLRGEDLELLSRELAVPAARISRWREQLLDGGHHCLTYFVGQQWAITESNVIRSASSPKNDKRCLDGYFVRSSETCTHERPPRGCTRGEAFKKNDWTGKPERKVSRSL